MLLSSAVILNRQIEVSHCKAADLPRRLVQGTYELEEDEVTKLHRKGRAYPIPRVAMLRIGQIRTEAAAFFVINTAP